MNERVAKILKRHLKYSDAELIAFKEREENAKVVNSLDFIARMEIHFEVTSSRGCNSGHTVGQKFVLDGAGNFLADKSPKRSCMFLLHGFLPFVFAIHELVYAGIAPKDIVLKFPNFGCPDVGVENCGWGHVNMHVSVVEIK